MVFVNAGRGDVGGCVGRNTLVLKVNWLSGNIRVNDEAGYILFSCAIHGVTEKLVGIEMSKL